MPGRAVRGHCAHASASISLAVGAGPQVTGDTVANMDLAVAVKAHRARRGEDKNAILTMVTRSPTSRTSAVSV